MQCGHRELRCLNDESFQRRNLYRHWDKTLGNGLAVHVETSVNGDVNREPQALQGAIGRRIEAGHHLHALGLAKATNVSHKRSFS